MSKLIDVVNSPWAITPDTLDTIVDIYTAHATGDRINLPEVEARLGRPLNNEQRGYDVVNGVAVLPLHGVVAKRMNMFQAISGGISAELVARDFQQALDDPSVKAIILDIDSPGGTVDGTEELANLIHASRGTKPIVSLANGLMASAGYWIGSAADEVVVASSTTNVGSIGVVVQHIDTSVADAQRGVTRREIYAGKFKRIVSDNKPLDAEGEQYLQDRVDYLYGVFLGAVSRNLGISVEAALAMAEGKLFIGQQAIDIGLATRQATLDQLITELAGSTSSPVKTHRAQATTGAQSNSEKPAMEISKELLEQEHADLVAAFREEGATAERQRILDVEAQAMAGHEELVKTLMFDGKTTGPEAAVQILKAEKAAQAQVQTDLQADAPNPAASAPVAGDEETETQPQKKDPKAVAKDAQRLVAEAESRGERLSYAAAVKQAKALED